MSFYLSYPWRYLYAHPPTSQIFHHNFRHTTCLNQVESLDGSHLEHWLAGEGSRSATSCCLQQSDCCIPLMSKYNYVIPICVRRIVMTQNNAITQNFTWIENTTSGTKDGGRHCVWYNTNSWLALSISQSRLHFLGNISSCLILDKRMDPLGTLADL